MTEEEKFLVVDKIEDMSLPLYKNGKCNSCGAEIGISKSSCNILDEHKDLKIICGKCFIEMEDDDIKLQRPSQEQIEELRTVYPDFGEAEIRRTLENIKKVKDEQRRTRIMGETNQGRKKD